MTLPNVVVTAATDDRLRPRDVKVYLVLYEELDPMVFRPVKHTWLARRVGVHRVSVHASVRRLCRAGYIKQGRRKPGDLCTYRIVSNPAPRQEKDRRSVPREAPDRRGGLRAP